MNIGIQEVKVNIKVVNVGIQEVKINIKVMNIGIQEKTDSKKTNTFLKEVISWFA